MFQLRDHPISRKLTFMNMAVSGSALLLACMSFVVYDAITIWQGLARYAASQADVIAANTISALLFDDPAAAEKTLSALSSSPNLASAVVYRQDGTPFAHYTMEGSNPPTHLGPQASLGARTKWLDEGFQIMFLRPIVSEGETVGFVSTAVVPVTLYDRMKRYLGIAGIVLTMSLLAALLVSSVFQRAVAKPIRHLAEVAETVSRDKKYSIRADATQSNDEVAVLVRAFNDMLAQIQERDSALQQARDGLEARVEERTAELQQAEEALRNLSGRLLTLQDQERRSIARELHDSTGQVLAALSLHLTMVQMEAGKLSPSAAKAVDDSINMVTEISRELRTLSHLLHPPLLDEAGLESALRWYVQGFADRSGIQAELEFSEDFGRQREEIETTVFRIVQESLTNVHRHSASPTAHVRVIRDRDSVRVEVSDRGKGMTVANRSKRAELGIGIQGMRERVSQLGGHFEIQSDANGTTVIASFECPLLQESTSQSSSESFNSLSRGAGSSLPKNPK